jgi:hypothetical protein
MVPLGALAFMPGNITHSNEFTVSIGDNHFVADQSAVQTHEILSRRIASTCAIHCISRSIDWQLLIAAAAAAEADFQEQLRVLQLQVAELQERVALKSDIAQGVEDMRSGKFVNIEETMEEHEKTVGMHIIDPS